MTTPLTFVSPDFRSLHDARTYLSLEEHDLLLDTPPENHSHNGVYWKDSVFSGIYQADSVTFGTIAEKITRRVFESRGYPTCDRSSSQHDFILVESGDKIEVKASRIDHEGKININHVRPTYDYDLLVLAVFFPTNQIDYFIFPEYTDTNQHNVWTYFRKQHSYADGRKRDTSDLFARGIPIYNLKSIYAFSAIIE